QGSSVPTARCRCAHPEPRKLWRSEAASVVGPAARRSALRKNRRLSGAEIVLERQPCGLRLLLCESLYDPKIGTMEGDASACDQSDATGFIRLNALRSKLRAAQSEVAHKRSTEKGFALMTDPF